MGDYVASVASFLILIFQLLNINIYASKFLYIVI